MKILYINVGMHAKNHNALMSYKNITFYVINNINFNNINLNDFDCVYSPSVPIDVSLYPNTKFIFGPHFSVFPELSQMNIISNYNITLTIIIYYIIMSRIPTTKFFDVVDVVIHK